MLTGEGIAKTVQKIQESLARGDIREGHARALLSISNRRVLDKPWHRAVRESLSVRAVEEAIGAEPPPNARLLRNLIIAAQAVQARPGRHGPCQHHQAGIASALYFHRAAAEKRRRERNATMGNREVRSGVVARNLPPPVLVAGIPEDTQRVVAIVACGKKRCAKRTAAGFTLRFDLMQQIFEHHSRPIWRSRPPPRPVPWHPRGCRACRPGRSDRRGD